MKNLTNEDLEFLKELSHELNTQSNDGNANPVFWGIQEEKTVVTDSEHGEVYVIYETYEGHEIYNSKDDNIDEFISNMECEEDLKDDEGNILTSEDIKRIILEEYRDCPYDFIKDYEVEEYGEGYVNYEYQLVEDTGAFLTKRAVKEHIELNHYHYNKPRTYAMTAWRNPEFGRLIEIIKKIEDKEVNE